MAGNERPPWTVRLAAHCEAVAREPLRPETVQAAPRAIFDAVVCALAGAGTEEIATLRASLGLPAPAAGRLARGGDGGMAAATAALYNGTCAHALELDDTHSFSSVHGAGPIVMAALTFAATRAARQRYGTEQILRAVVVGYEAACRLGGACRGFTSPYARGFHPTGVHGVFGAAAAIGVLLGFDADTYASAFGTAGSLSSGLMACVSDGSWTKKLHAGWAAHGGILAANLAAGGFRGPATVLEGPFGFIDAHSLQPDIEYLWADLPARREVERISFKLFGCCRSIHPAITATLAAVDGTDVGAEDIAAIELTIADEDIDLVAEPRRPKIAPTTTEEARFSIYWGTAVAAALRRATPAEFAPPVLGSAPLRRLAASVSYRTDPEMTATRPEFFPCHSRVILRDGRVLEARVAAPRGDFRNPVADRDLLDKAHHLLAAGPVDADALFDSVWQLGAVDSLEALMDQIFSEWLE